MIKTPIYSVDLRGLPNDKKFIENNVFGLNLRPNTLEYLRKYGKNEFDCSKWSLLNECSNKNILCVINALVLTVEAPFFAKVPFGDEVRCLCMVTSKSMEEKVVEKLNKFKELFFKASFLDLVDKSNGIEIFNIIGNIIFRY